MGDKNYTLFVTLGFTAYITFFAVLASNDYWSYFYDIVFTSISAALLNTFETIAVFLANPIQKRKSPVFLIKLGLLINIFSIVILPSFIFITNWTARYILSFIPICLLGIAAGFLFTAFGSVASRVDKKYNQALSLGTGLSEVTVQILKIIFAYTSTLLSDKSYEEQLFIQSLVYFIFAGIYVCCSFFILQQLIKKYTFTTQTIDSHELETLEQSQSGTVSFVEHDDGGMIDSFLSSSATSVEKIPQKLSSRSKILAIFMFGNQFITYLIFPAITTAIPCISNMNAQKPMIDPWYSLFIMSGFLFSDFFGRLVAKIRIVQNALQFTQIIIFVCVRLLFIPLFFLINLPRINQYPVIHNDYISVALVILFGFSGGLALPLLFIRAQDLAVQVKEKHKISNIMTATFSSGCSISGWIGIGVSYYLSLQ
ncbi:Nucleoside transporter [Spironucleus salmonicida]|uniref:Nucleoside transporter n=1 Tax=Spironucleus salmonicida TaxID=348837 RepID=V6LQN3_9EUKA|nr:Nucleoside transporter [Spironucleus salmonicida]|eukprot:EST46890.1 Equilibrative nucleoside transporter family protein [Spironucleus salmonicida]